MSDESIFRRMRHATPLEQLRALLGDRPTVKLAADHPRDTCSRCGEPTRVALTVVDVLGHESVTCPECWRIAQAGRP